jgi:transposase InsO family protein
VRLALIRLAKQYGRYGYRKVGQLLRMEGWCVNHKKVERIWREEGLQLPQRHKRRKRLYHHDASVIRLRPHYPNHIWSIDFVHDKLSDQRPYKMLTVIDEYTREAYWPLPPWTAIIFRRFWTVFLVRDTQHYCLPSAGFIFCR